MPRHKMLLLPQQEVKEISAQIRKGAPTHFLSYKHPVFFYLRQQSQGKKKWHFPKGEEICVDDHDVLKRNIFSQRSGGSKELYRLPRCYYPYKKTADGSDRDSGAK